MRTECSNKHMLQDMNFSPYEPNAVYCSVCFSKIKPGDLVKHCDICKEDYCHNCQFNGQVFKIFSLKDEIKKAVEKNLEILYIANSQSLLKII